MDSRKPLTVGESEDVQDDVKLINEFLELCSHRLDPWNMARVADAVAWLGVDKGKIVEWVHGYWDGEDVERKMMDMEKENSRLLSLLTPPPDAAVREAVRRVQGAVNTAEGNGGMQFIPADVATLRTLLRAVQSPRLTKEQASVLCLLVNMVRTFGDKITVSERIDAMDRARAAFPELAGEVGRG